MELIPSDRTKTKTQNKKYPAKQTTTINFYIPVPLPLLLQIEKAAMPCLKQIETKAEKYMRMEKMI
jgi:hypothetical protein